MDDRPYYYRLRGRTIGPLPLRQMRQLAQRAQIGRTTDVSRDGQQWGKAGDFVEVFQAENAFDSPPLDSMGATTPDVSEFTGSSVPAPSQPAQGPLWYYTLNGSQQGPVPLADLQQMVSNGTLSSQEHVIPEGGTEWISAKNVPMPANASGNQVVVNMPQQPAAEGTNGLAIAGFVLSLVGCPPLGMILSLVALNSKNQSQRGLAIAGAIIGGLVTICGCAVWILYFLGVMAAVAGA